MGDGWKVFPVGQITEVECIHRQFIFKHVFVLFSLRLSLSSRLLPWPPFFNIWHDCKFSLTRNSNRGNKVFCLSNTFLFIFLFLTITIPNTLLLDSALQFLYIYIFLPASHFSFPSNRIVLSAERNYYWLQERTISKMQTNAKPAKPYQWSHLRTEQSRQCSVITPGLWIEIQDLDGVAHSTSLL